MADALSVVNLIGAIMSLKGTSSMNGAAAFWPKNQAIGGYWPRNQAVGDAGPHDDGSYAGDYDPTNPLSLDYYRQQINDFQTCLNQLDVLYQQLQETSSIGLPDDVYQDLYSFAGEIDDKRNELSAVASALRGLSIAADSMGIRLPSPSMPAGLGVAPAVILGSAAIIAGAVALIFWERDIATRVQTYFTNMAAMDGMTPEAKAQFANAANRIATAANSGVLGDLATTAKWVVIGLLGYLAYQSYSKKRN